jgi:alkanesulfonate monooxygenase SsuD/methylene tetrahydromethanopterin reductase-like flavin-dependent oxidoreductase (luciferase family)
MTTLGVVCLPQVPPEQLRNVAVAADGAGLEELWLWEDCFWGGAVPACSAALAWTTNLRVTIGVGHGIQSWMRQAGAAAESPMTLLREYLAALRALLAGGRYVHLDDVALEWPPTVPPQVLVGAIGPRTLRLSAETADGTVLVAGSGPEEVRRARELIAEGQAAAGRVGGHRLVVHLNVDDMTMTPLRRQRPLARWRMPVPIRSFFSRLREKLMTLSDSSASLANECALSCLNSPATDQIRR